MKGIYDGEKQQETAQTDQNIEDGTGFSSNPTADTREDSSTNNSTLEQLPLDYSNPSTSAFKNWPMNGFGNVTSLINENDPNTSDQSEEDTLFLSKIFS